MRTLAGALFASVVLASPVLARAADPRSAAKGAEPELTAPGTAGEVQPVWLDPKMNFRLDLHGSLQLWYYQPLANIEDPHSDAKPVGPEDPFFEVFLASIEISAKMDAWGVFVNPRFRDTPSRQFFTSNVWLAQAYLSYDAPHALVKVGKIENQLSRINDETFYLNTLFFDGIKYDVDYGASVEGSWFWANGFGLSYVAQYFLLDGHTNGSLRDRDTVWIDGVRRQHIGVARIEPAYWFNEKSSLRFGAGFEAFYVDLNDGTQGPVYRADADVSFAWGPARVFGEGLVQIGQSVNAYPFPATPAKGSTPAKPGQGSAENFYALAGAGWRIWRFYPRYAFSLVRYADRGVTEMIHVPGVTFTAHDNISVLFEYGYWPRTDPKRSWLLDSSLNLLLVGRF